MIRCRGYDSVPSHYEIAMCFYGRWGTCLAETKKRTFWRKGPEYLEVQAFISSDLNPNVQDFRTFLQQDDGVNDDGG